jgi:hypothetical protein
MNKESNLKKPTAITGVLGGGAHALLLLRTVIAALSTLFVVALVAAAAGSDAPVNNPRLTSLQIEIWPEFDRPAALVILKGEISPNVALPASVSVRIPVASGGPLAVAFSTAASGDLLTTQYESESAGDRITLKFQVPQRFFHVEFYEPIATSAPERNFTYVWPGDLATDHLAVIVQEPAGTTDLAVTPRLEAMATGQNGLRYRSQELGAFQAGKQLDVNVRYTKTDPRTSTAILNPRAADSQTTAPILKPEAPESSPLPFAIPSKKAATIWLAAVVAVLVLGGIAAALWARRRKSAPESQAPGAGFCRKCRSPTASGDQFCAKCGAPLA